MSSLLLLIPISVVLLSVAGLMLWWAVKRKQFDDLEHHALDIFDNEDTDLSTNTTINATKNALRPATRTATKNAKPSKDTSRSNQSCEP